jgi:hypothetical protein
MSTFEDASCHVANNAFEPPAISPIAAIDGGLFPWPQLTQLRIGEAELVRRQDGIGGSDANIILGGDPDRILNLWAEKRGEQQPEDLAGKLAVMLGCWTEAFNRQWYERETGYLVTNAGAAHVCARDDWRRCTLDGVVGALGAIWEAKHTNAFAQSDEVVARYMPQLQHNMAVTGRERAVLSVIFGNSKWEVFEIAADWMYQEELLIAEARFWDCVRSGVRPVAIAPPVPPKPIGVREICLEGNNAWAAAAADWLAHREAARLHGSAAAVLKELVEPDVKRAFGHGIEARRSKSGALTIRELAL